MTKLGRVSNVQVKACSNPSCPDTGATRVIVHRHHMGCEAMMIRHLLTKQAREPWVQALTIRYDLFHPDDVVQLCIMCHEEMHKRYMPHIKNFCYKIGPIATMNEAQIKRNMDTLRGCCKTLLKRGFTVRKGIISDYYGKAPRTPRRRK